MGIRNKRMRWLLSTGAALMVASSIGFAMQTASAAPGDFGGEGAIRNSRFDRAGCLDADVNHATEDGAQVQVFRCHFRANQIWNIVTEPGETGKKIVNSTVVDGVGNKCLEAVGAATAAQGARVELATCSSSDAQLWDFGSIANNPDLAIVANRAGTNALRASGDAARYVLELNVSSKEDTGGLLNRADERMIRFGDDIRVFTGEIAWEIPRI
jgi:hypothetical protein